MQRAFGQKHNTVAEGRDTGTVVFPGADLKVYVVADIAIRAVRRLRDLGGGGMTEMVSAMFRRDHRDRNRDESPLRLPPGALWLDGTSMTVAGQVEFVLDHYRRRRSR
jgi:cytidylate kinase